MTVVELTIERLSKSGEGVGAHEGRAVFVPAALPGETVRVELTQVGNVLRGAILELLKASLSRRQPSCVLASSCGGCDWLHVDEQTQLEQKQQIVLSAFSHLGGLSLDACEVEAPMASPRGMAYRRRAVLHPTPDGGLGFFGRRSHERIRVEACPALTAGLGDLPGRLARRLGPILKFIDEVRLLEAGGALAVSIHLKEHLRPKARELAAQLLEQEGLAQVVLVPEGEGHPVVFGVPSLDEKGVRHRPDGFAQANFEVNAVLQRTAAQWAAAGAETDVLELFSGNGNLTFGLARTARHVTAVESSAISVALAQAGARAMGVGNVRFVQGDAESTTRGLLKESARFDVLLVDPPRAGAAGLGAWASRLLVKRVVYLSCDPGSLARDASELAANGYLPKRLRVFDLFPQTRHVETLVAFER